MAALNFVREERRRLPRIKVATAGGDMPRGHSHDNARVDFNVPAQGRLIITWSDDGS
jgi:hypothetical protein